jgi:hypothetical protein
VRRADTNVSVQVPPERLRAIPIQHYEAHAMQPWAAE